MKKLIALVLCLMMLLVVFTACNGNGTESGTQSGTASTASTDSAVESDAIESIVVVRYGSKTTNQDVANVTKAINEYIGPEYNLNIEQIYLDDYASTLQLQVSSQMEYDTFWLDGAKVPTFLKSNSLYDFSDKLAEHEDLYNSMPEKIWQTITWSDGAIYSIPTYKESAAGSEFVIATSTLEEAGLSAEDLPEKASFAEMEPYVEAVSKVVDWAYIPSFTQASSYAREHALQEDLGQINEFLAVDLEEFKTIKLAPEFDAYVDQHNLLKTWIDKGYVQPDCLIEGTAVAFNKETIAAKQAGWGYYPTVPNSSEQAEASYGTPVTLVTHVDPQMSNNTPLGSAYAIASYTEKIDAVLSYFDALYTDKEFADLTCYGIEGTHYTRNADGAVIKTKDSGFDNGAWCCVNVMCVSITEGESANKAELYQKYNEEAAVSKIAGFRFDTTGLDAEMAALSDVYNTYDKALLYGVETSEITIENYIKALNDAGAQKVVEACQKQFDEWLASK